MELLKADIKKSCEIVLWSDTHDGDVHQASDKVHEMIEWIGAKNNRYFVHLGDAIEAIRTDDKRYQSDTTTQPIPVLQALDVVRQFRPIRKHCLAWLKGNHEDALSRSGDLVRDIICRELEMPYGSYTCKLRLENNGNPLFKAFLWHGPRSAAMNSNAKDYVQRQANMLALLKRRLEQKAGDCLVMCIAHTHKLLILPPSSRLVLSDDGDKIRQSYIGQGCGLDEFIELDRRWYVNTGCAIRLYVTGVDGYAERAGYDPMEIGCAIAEIDGGKLVNIRKEVW